MGGESKIGSRPLPCAPDVPCRLPMLCTARSIRVPRRLPALRRARYRAHAGSRAACRVARCRDDAPLPAGMARHAAPACARGSDGGCALRARAVRGAGVSRREPGRAGARAGRDRARAPGVDRFRNNRPSARRFRDRDGAMGSKVFRCRARAENRGAARSYGRGSYLPTYPAASARLTRFLGFVATLASFAMPTAGAG